MHEEDNFCLVQKLQQHNDMIQLSVAIICAFLCHMILILETPTLSDLRVQIWVNRTKNVTKNDPPCRKSYVTQKLMPTQTHGEHEPLFLLARSLTIHTIGRQNVIEVLFFVEMGEFHT